MPATLDRLVNASMAELTKKEIEDGEEDQEGGQNDTEGDLKSLEQLFQVSTAQEMP
jgi:hypothetical protein